MKLSIHSQVWKGTLHGTCDDLSMLGFKLNLSVASHQKRFRQLVCIMFTLSSWRLNSQTTQLFVQELVYAYNKENYKAHHHWLFVGNSSEESSKGPFTRKGFHVRTSHVNRLYRSISSHWGLWRHISKILSSTHQNKSPWMHGLWCMGS